MALTQDQQVALIFLGYLLVPVVLFFLYWFVGFIRRRVLKKGGGDEASNEGEA